MASKNLALIALATNTRSIETQSWPAEPTAPAMAISAARETSALSSTIIGFLPPNSSETPISRPAARWATILPVAVDPVKAT